jgi:hypothetical protein
MSQITVWKCDQTGKLFEDKAKYQSHLRKLARERNTKRKLTVIEAEADAWWQAAYNKEMTIDQWRQFVIDNQSRFWAEAAKTDPFDWNYIGKKNTRGKNGVHCPIPELLEFTEFNVRWNPTVSNSHSRPHNGVTCWSSREAQDGRPTSYPGTILELVHTLVPVVAVVCAGAKNTNATFRALATTSVCLPPTGLVWLD